MIVGTSTTCSAVCSAKTHTAPVRMTGRGDLGHFDNLLGNRCIDLSAYLQQLVRHLRHRNFKRRHDERAVANLLHGAPLVPFLRPDANEAVRPSPFGVFVEQTQAHRILPGVGRHLASWSVVRLGPCTSERRVVQGCGQLHAHRHPLVSQPRAEPALPPPPCGARNMGAISTRAIRWVFNHHGHTNKETRALLNGYIILKE